MKRIIIGILIFLVSCNTDSQTVIAVHDGDTFYTKEGLTVRMAEIDAPELSQDFGEEAKIYLQNKIQGKKVKIIQTDIDRYGRSVCEVYINGIWINKLMVDEGLAWAYKKYSTLNAAEKVAQKQKLGLWAGKNIIPPFKYRKSARY